jgi:hypothetical protein
MRKDCIRKILDKEIAILFLKLHFPEKVDKDNFSIYELGECIRTNMNAIEQCLGVLKK